MVPVRPQRVIEGVTFVWIAPGTFPMGSPKGEPDRRSDEKQHRVMLTAGFWLGVTSVTQSQWVRVVGENPSNFTRTGTRGDRVTAIADADLANFPVDTISWNLARQFCRLASANWGRRVVLPTEAQWEYACRAGTTTPFHFGHVLNGTLANCNGVYPYGTGESGPNLERPTPVGNPAYPPNAWGVYDMHGTIWDWCQDAYHARKKKLPENDPVSDSPRARLRVLRGGSWFSHAHQCRSAHRHHVEPTCGAPGLGIRLVCLD
jgi:formylglycine-generating enzyme required for sulfatase activity